MNRSTVLGFLLVVASAFFFAVAGPVAKALYGAGWTPGSVVLIRLVGSALLLAIPTMALLRGKWRLVREHWRLLATYGVVCMAGMQGTYFVAVQHLSVAVALLLQMMGAPLIIVFWLWARSWIRPATVTFIGVAVAIVGVVLVLDPRAATLSVFGVAAALASAACLAVYFFVSSSAHNPLPPIAFTGLGMWIGAAGIAAANVTGLMPGRFVAADVDFAGARIHWVIPLGLLVLFTVGAYVCGILGLRHIGPTVGSFLNLVEVPFSAVAAWIVLAEGLTAMQLAGGVVILLGTVFVKWGDIRMEQQIARERDRRPDDAGRRGMGSVSGGR